MSESTFKTLSELANSEVELDEDTRLLEKLDKALYMTTESTSYLKRTLWCIGTDFDILAGTTLIGDVDPMMGSVFHPRYILRQWFIKAKRMCLTDLFARIFFSYIREE